MVPKGQVLLPDNEEKENLLRNVEAAVDRDNHGHDQLMKNTNNNVQQQDWFDQNVKEEPKPNQILARNEKDEHQFKEE